MSDKPAPPVTLDATDRAALRAEAHRALDLALDFLDGVRDRPVWRQVPDSAKTALMAPPPRNGIGMAAAIDTIRDHVLPWGNGNTHPRFFGWVHGSGNEAGMIGEMIAAAFNANLGGRDHAANYVEKQVIGWWRDIFGFPDRASGLIVSGTSMATIIGLAVARQKCLGPSVRMRGNGDAKLVAYTSAEAHSSVAKAFEMLGLGSDAVRKIPVRDDFSMDMDALADFIAIDRAAGLKPFALIATTGAVNTGASDDLEEAADIADREDLWLHVDGAFGALAILAPAERHRLKGIDRADSLAFDFHKWLHVPYDAAMILVRDGADHLAAFSSRPDYLAGATRGLAAGEPWFCEYGPELSRGFRALKVWMTMSAYGLETLGASIAGNCALARSLEARIRQTPDLEILAPAALNIVCFRYVPSGRDAASCDALNAEIVIRLHESGIAAPSATRVRGRQAIRVNITNHRTTEADLSLLLDAVVTTGRAIDRGDPP